MNRHAVAFLAACSAWLACANALANEQPLQTQRCNDPPPALGAEGPVEAGGNWVTKPTGTWLHPGQTLKTNGTGVDDSGELDGWVVFTRQPQDFSFITAQGTVAGQYQERIDSGSDKRCKSHVRFMVLQGCINKLTIHDYLHPSKLVADYRNDQEVGVRSRSATRSLEDLDGRTTVTFNLPAKVCAGQASRWLLLNTNVRQVHEQNTLEFFAPNGLGSSERLPFYVP